MDDYWKRTKFAPKSVHRFGDGHGEGNNVKCLCDCHAHSGCTTHPVHPIGGFLVAASDELWCALDSNMHFSAALPHKNALCAVSRLADVVEIDKDGDAAAGSCTASSAMCAQLPMPAANQRG